MTRTRAAIYVRVSSAAQEEDGTSLETQRDRCRTYATARGYAVPESMVFVEVFSGLELWQRPKLTKLREAFRRGEVDAVIVYSVDRYSRDPVHLGMLIEEADHAGVETLFVSEPLDNSLEDGLIRYIRGYSARVEAEKIRERSLRGKRARSESGRPLPASRARYGYRWTDQTRSRLEHDESKAPVVRRMYDEVKAGATLRRVAAQLTAERIPTPTGKSIWYAEGVRDIIQDPIYAGLLEGWRWGTEKTRSRNGKVYRKRVERDPSERIPLPAETAPAIVDLETWKAVQERLRLNKQLAARNNRNPTAALLRGGFARCGYCGRSMSVQRCRNQYVYWCCANNHLPGGCPGGKFNISVKILDEAVWTRVQSIIQHPEVIAEQVRRALENDPTEHDLASVDRRLASIQIKRSSYVEDLPHLSKSSKAAIYEKLAQLDAEEEQIRQERVGLVQRRQVWIRALERAGDLEEWCRLVSGRLDQVRTEEPQTAIIALGIQVRVWRTDHAPRYEITARPEVELPADIVETTSSHSSALAAAGA